MQKENEFSFSFPNESNFDGCQSYELVGEKPNVFAAFFATFMM